MKKVAIIGTVGIPAKYGGFETLAHQITRELKNQFEFTVYCSSSAYSKTERKAQCHGAKLVYVPLKANGIQSIWYDMYCMIHALFYADVLLILGVSGGVLIPFIKWLTHKVFITNIDGLEWRRNKWGTLAKVFLKFSERLAIYFSDAVITDNVAIQRYAKRTYGLDTHYIAYGGDHARPVQETAFLKALQLSPKSYAFKVARIEPENNIHLVLHAFQNANLPLLIVGNWEASAYGRRLKKAYSTHSHMMLLDPIYDQKLLDQLRQNAAIYVHGHSAGGTNPSLVEAMCLGLPIACFDVVYNRETTLHQAFFFKSAEQLGELVETVSPVSLALCAQQMGRIGARKYAWHVIAHQYGHLFKQLVYEKTKIHLPGALNHPLWPLFSSAHLSFKK